MKIIPFALSMLTAPVAYAAIVDPVVWSEAVKQAPSLTIVALIAWMFVRANQRRDDQLVKREEQHDQLQRETNATIQRNTEVIGSNTEVMAQVTRELQRRN